MELRLKELRFRRDMTQREMAAQLNISKSYYNYFETGERVIPIPRLNDYCNIFKLSADYVLGLTDIKEIQEKEYVLDNKLMGKRLKETRRVNGLTQKDLAELLNTSQSTISSYEHGKTMILTEALYEVCVKLNSSADYIIGRIDEPKKLDK